MKTLISKLQDAGIMIFLDGSETIHYKAYRDLDEGAAKMLLQELKRRKQEVVAYLTRQDEIFQAYAAMFEAFKKLHQTKGVSQNLLNELIALDEKIERNEPGVLLEIRTLHHKVQNSSFYKKG